ncbi:hypothetical protein [Streptomyces sp. NPDC058644]
MMLRRYHPTKPDPEPDSPDTPPADADNAPQADKPAGRSAARAKAKKE